MREFLIGVGIVVFIILFITNPTFRCAVCHPIKVVVNGVRDLYNYFKKKKWNEAPYGKIVGYIADSGRVFGCGKTLSSVEFITSLYEKYNNKKVWCGERKKFVTQKVIILSNVKLNKIPYINFISLKQYVSLLKERYEKDKEEDTLSVIYAFCDEASSILNSRSFKDNLSSNVIASLLTTRHYHSSLLYSSQKNTLVDKLLREVTSYYIGCDKLWRFQRINYYDASELEYSTNPTMVKPYQRECWFIENKHFALYNTYELLQTIDKKCNDNDFMTEEEILAHLQTPEANPDAITNTSKKYRKSRKKLNK